MKRTATAQWQGDGATGKGQLSTQSGTLSNQPYSFLTRFENQDGKSGTNPEELIAAAHAAYAVERNRAMPADHTGPAPYGGVGGTREGLKCLHAHYAYWLAGGDDPVGQWTNDRLVERDLLPVNAPKRVIR